MSTEAWLAAVWAAFLVGLVYGVALKEWRRPRWSWRASSIPTPQGQMTLIFMDQDERREHARSTRTYHGLPPEVLPRAHGRQHDSYVRSRRLNGSTWIYRLETGRAL